MRLGARRDWQRVASPFPEAECYRAGELRAMRAREGGRWHLSISCESGRYPTWDEIADARYDLLPLKCDFALPLPPPRDYVNHANVFHLWEIRDPALPVDRGAFMLRTHERG